MVMEIIPTPDEPVIEGPEENVSNLFSGDIELITESSSGVMYRPHTPHPLSPESEGSYMEFINIWIALGVSMFLMLLGTVCFIKALESGVRRRWRRSNLRRRFSAWFPNWFPEIEEPVVQAVLNLPAVPGGLVNLNIPAVPNGPLNPIPQDLPNAVPHAAGNPNPQDLPNDPPNPNPNGVPNANP